MNGLRSIAVIGAILVFGPIAFAQDGSRVSASTPILSPSLFAPADVINAPMLAKKLGAASDPVSAFVWSELPPALQASLSGPPAPPSEQLSALLDALDFVVQGDSIYDPLRFAAVAVSTELLALADSAPQGEALRRLNRRLLEDAYPRELRRSPPLPATNPSVQTDRSDYAPGSIAHIRGSGFLAGETLSLQVLHADGTQDNGEDHAAWSVAAASDGTFQSTWHVCEDDCLGSTLKLTAAGHTSGRIATAIFTDATGAPTYQQIRSFGAPSVGSFPYSTLIQGTGGALYGTASSGGSRGFGTAFRLNPDGSGFTDLFDFTNAAAGGNPYAGLLQGTDGALYGAASSGGSALGGTVFKLNQDGSGFTVLANFDDATTGSAPIATLIQGSDGALYGTASSGGAHGAGTVYKLNPDGSGFTVLHHFTFATDGATPYAGLVQGAGGALYGTAQLGGSLGEGTVYKLNPDGSGFTVLKNFDLTVTGGQPRAALLKASDGELYGTASSGGSLGDGTVFKLNTDGSGFTVVQNFTALTTGTSPFAALIQGTDGALYGTTILGGSGGSGTVFKLNPNGTGFTALENFDNTTTGADLIAGLLLGTDGALYGAASQRGSRGFGTVFKLNTDATGFTILKDFYYSPGAAEDGAFPFASVTQGTDGALYGTTVQGGAVGFGTVFKTNPDGSGFAVLKDFDNTTSGGSVNAGLIKGTDGALYGTAQLGGAFGDGTVFKLNPDGSGFTVLKNFDGATTGSSIAAGLLQGTDGKLYGTASQGGLSGNGTVFKLNSDGSGFAVLWAFDDPTNGINPQAGLIQGTDGALYGTAVFGGANGDGTVFKLGTDGTNFTVLHDFDAFTSGSQPIATLMQGTDGALYGAANVGGIHADGTIYKLNPDGSGFTVLKDLENPTTGANPFAALTQATDGALYGTAFSGGVNGAGTAFKLDPDGNNFTVLVNFDDATTGSAPIGGLIQGTNGDFYGTTAQGGDAGVGTVFRLTFTIELIANAGADFSVDEGQLVTLDGTGSSITDNSPLTYAWVQLNGGTPVTLQNAGTAHPSFSAPVVALGGETLSFRLTVTAGSLTATDTVSVTVVNLNHTPVADAGSDQTVAEGSPVTLHGEGSFDVDHDSLTYHWSQVSGTPVVSLSGSSSVSASFTAPSVGPSGATLVFALLVDDGFANAVDQVTIQITNTNNAPTAVAGDDQTVDENTPVTLNGIHSSDPDGDALTFAWTQIGGPSVTLANASTETPGFTAPFVTTAGEDLTFQLTVDDNFGGTASDTVVVHVRDINAPPSVDSARPTTQVLPHPDHGVIVVGIVGVTDPNHSVAISITSVTQNEPTNGQGDGDTPIDAIINNDGTVLLRAERAGDGDGRVYHIHFTATTPGGTACGLVTVSVPHDKKHPAVDTGELYDSTH